MSADQLIQQGDFKGALALLRQDNAGPSADPGQLLMAFNIAVRLQLFDEAETWMKRLLQAAPQVSEAMGGFSRAARAEAIATARMKDPAAAGKRSALGAPPVHGLAYVKAAVLNAQKDYPGAVAAIAEAKAQTPAVKGTLTWVNGKTARFVDLIDTDELTGPILPCYSGDVVLDLPYSQLKSVRFLEGKTSFDVMWMPTEIVSVEGKRLILRVPSFYVGTGVADIPQVRTGQMTTWDRERGFAIGQGQRDFKVSTEDGGALMVGMLQIDRIEFDAPIQAKAEEPKSLWKRIFG